VGLALGAAAVVLAILGLTPSLAWISEVPLLAAALLLPTLACGLAGFRAASRSGRLLGGALSGGLAGCIGGAAGGFSYVAFGKPLLNVGVALLLGAGGGSAVGLGGGLLARRRKPV